MTWIKLKGRNIFSETSSGKLIKNGWWLIDAKFMTQGLYYIFSQEFLKLTCDKKNYFSSLPAKTLKQESLQRVDFFSHKDQPE